MNIHDEAARGPMKVSRTKAFPGLCLAIALLAGCAGTGTSGERVSYVERGSNDRIVKEGFLVDGIQEGRWTYYYENGQKQYEGGYANDIPDGAWTYWYENGAKEMEGAFADERRTGTWAYWYKDNSLRARGAFADGREEGEWSFFDPGGKLRQRGDYAGGQPALRWTTFGDDGQPRSEGWYLAGQKVGPWRAWDERGIVTETTYPLPADHQLVDEVWPGGGPRRRGFLRGGRPTGRWVSFHRNGNRRMLVDLDTDGGEGWGQAYGVDGELLASGPMRRGQPAGNWMAWDRGESRRLERSDVRMPRAPSDDWSDSAIASSLRLDEVVDVWLSEMSGPAVAAAAPPARDPTELVTTVPASAAVVPEERVDPPIRAQPWTVREETGMESFLKNYGTDPTARRRRPSSRYARSGGAAPVGGNKELADAIVGKALPITAFEAADGSAIDLAEFRGKRNVLVVILRGFAGQVCVYCEAQTRALAPSAPVLSDLDTEVVVVYPGSKSGLEAFEEAYLCTFGAAPPNSFRFLYDQDLRFVKSLGIAGDLADPSCLILDKEGTVQFAYIGLTRDDRPPASRLIEECKSLD